MSLNHIIAHRIQRLEPGKPATIDLQESCWALDGRVEECFRELKVAVIKRFTKDYGCFSEDYASHPLSSWLNEFTCDKLGFDSLSKKAMQQFKQELDKTEGLIDGFLFFAHEKLEHDECVHLFLAQHNTGQYIDGDLSINESFYLDTSNINLAAKINLSDWQSGDKHRVGNSLGLLRWRGEKELTDAFVNFIGFTNQLDLAAETDEFLETVTEYTKELPETEAFQTKKKIVDYCLEQGKADKPVVIEELSVKLASEPITHSRASDSDSSEDNNTKPSLPKFANFIAENTPSLKPEIIPDKSRLNQFVRISGRDQNLSISFSTGCLGENIEYDPETEKLIIRSIPASLKKKLKKLHKPPTLGETV